MKASERNLQRLLEPRTVAAIGGAPAERAIRQSDRLGFEGEIWPVHPTRHRMAGRPVYRSLKELPGVPDAAFVGVNRWLTVEAVHELAAMGCGGAVLYASGFAEAGRQGAALQEQLIADHDMPLVGPNCYGTISGVSGAALWPDIHGCRRVDTGPGLISQSGNITLNLTMNGRGVDFSYVISLGNQASVTAEECLAHFARRPEVTAVGLYLEAITDPLSFGRAALACHDARTPVVVLKSGRSDRAGVITSSHTGALSSPAAAYDALFERYGIVTVDSLPELTTTLGLLGTIGPLGGNRIVSLSCSGGEAALVADRALHHPVVFEPFAPEHAARVKATLSELVTITNPLDYHTFIWGDRAALERCFSEVLSGPFDAAMLVLDWPSDGNDDTHWWPTLRAFETATGAVGTPGMVVAGLSENLPDRIREHLTERGVAVAYSIDEALGGMAAAAALGQWLGRAPPPLHLPSGEPPPSSPGSVGATLDEPAAKALLVSAGIRVPDGVVLSGTEHVGSSSVPERLRFPLVAKTVGPGHKSELNGVITGIRSPEALKAAIRRLWDEGRPVLVEEQVTGGVAELLVSVRRQVPIGLVMTLGAGGTLVELLADTATLLLPASPHDLDRVINRLRIGRRLRSIRGGSALALDALASVVDHLTSLMTRCSDLFEVEINPLIVTPDSVWAVDALATTAPAAVCRPALYTSGR